jgi:hypothetical protein
LPVVVVVDITKAVVVALVVIELLLEHLEVGQVLNLP